MRPSLPVRRAIRSLRRYPALTVLSILALAFGIGLPTAMFSIVDAAVLRGIPVADPGGLMHLELRRAGATGEGYGTAARDYIAWSEQQRSFTALAAFRTGNSAFRSGLSVNRIDAAWLTPGAFALLGVDAQVGRTFGDGDSGTDVTPPVVISWTVWREQFSGDAGVVGKSVIVDGEARVIVGVMPQNFHFPYKQDLWIPMRITQQEVADSTFPRLDVFGVLRRNVSRDQAKSEFAVIAERTAQLYPTTNRGYEITIKPFAERFIGENATSTLYLMLCAVLLVLVIACANVANLLLVRAVHRVRETAICMALGRVATKDHRAAAVGVSDACSGGWSVGHIHSSRGSIIAVAFSWRIPSVLGNSRHRCHSNALCPVADDGFGLARGHLARHQGDVQRSWQSAARRVGRPYRCASGSGDAGAGRYSARLVYGFTGCSRLAGARRAACANGADGI